ncbi:MAG: ATP-binding protein [Spirochaetia bacterium]|jgi:ATP-dependent DNA helicase RecG|nr:ATP-binding protein [Spirochaetales bacterium]MDX9785024.1 ATP-binding protein [Spirochaetia bacterium]
MKAYIRYEGIQRVEEFLFPELALREALLNAVIHKDYASGIPIQISVYEDKIMIWNSGVLPQNWNVDRLLGKHPSIPYNPLLANAFFRTGYIES